ncbi:MAG TPA: hypothetical protein VL742_03475 [Casimicrobiaceae bacterium]|nr:hypothetical protein [Casimicrobiaceae bacterium]
MTFADSIHSAIERVSATSMAAFDMLDRMSEGALVIFAIGLAAALVGLGCLIYGLRGEWRRWAKIHVSYWRRKD